MKTDLIIKPLGRVDYQLTWAKMQSFTQNRDESTVDELWLLEHNPVFTQGLAGKPEHVLNPKDIPIVQTDRGGQVTYHGPGQLVVYPLLNLKRLNLGPRQYVMALEQIIIDLLASLRITAKGSREAPGIYVDGAKICSIGLRVRRGCSYHGIAFNIDMDLRPFSYINPCGFKNLAMTQLKDHTTSETLTSISTKIIPYFTQIFGYNAPHIQETVAME